MMKAIERAGTFGFPLAALIAAMGAAQLSLLRYKLSDGGSAPSAGSDPTKINVGKRRDTVDIARSQSAEENCLLPGERNG